MPSLQNPRALTAAGALLLALGAGHGLFGRLAAAPSDTSTQPASGSLPLHLRVYGDIEVPDGVNPAEIETRAHFDELPLDLFGRGVAAGGGFALEATFVSKTRPTQLSFSARGPGGLRKEIARIPLTLEGDNELGCHLARLHLSARPEPPALPAVGRGTPLTRTMTSASPDPEFLRQHPAREPRT